MGRIRDVVSQLTIYQKVSAVLLAFFGVAAVFLAILQMQTRIVDGGEARRTSGQAVFTDLATQTSATAAILAQDTDKDGLTDTDEIKTYHTSPYLSDSDSDGKSDGEEIADNTNPNCPEGETCFGLGNATSVDRASTDGVETQSAAQPSNTTAITGVTAKSGSEIPAFNAATVRQALRDSGVPDAQVDAVTDDELRKMYDDAAKEAQAKKAGQTTTTAPATNSGTSSAPGATNAATTADIVNQARVILVQSGMTKAQVDALTDEQILQLLTQAAAKNAR